MRQTGRSFTGREWILILIRLQAVLPIQNKDPKSYQLVLCIVIESYSCMEEQMPEEIYQKLPKKDKKMLIIENWPK